VVDDEGRDEDKQPAKSESGVQQQLPDFVLNVPNGAAQRACLFILTAL
jgi:hypothetical protein